MLVQRDSRPENIIQCSIAEQSKAQHSMESITLLCVMKDRRSFIASKWSKRAMKLRRKKENSSKASKTTNAEVKMFLILNSSQYLAKMISSSKMQLKSN